MGETGVWRRETIHSMLRRLPGWDYRGRAIYQITLVLADRASAALGRLEVRRKGDGATGWAGVGAAKGWFMAIGNRFLLDRPLAQIQVSRRDFGYRRERKAGGGLKICRDARGEPIVDFSTPLYAERKAALFAAAKVEDL